MESVKVSGFVVLFVGVAVLLFTFYSAYQFLLEAGITTGEGGLMEIFGETLGPLIDTCMKAIYLGIMGWIGSILTRRGVQTISMGEEEGQQKKTSQSKGTKEPNQNQALERAKQLGASTEKPS